MIAEKAVQILIFVDFLMYRSPSQQSLKALIFPEKCNITGLSMGEGQCPGSVSILNTGHDLADANTCFYSPLQTFSVIL
jgi:hypothetical protein